MKWKMKKKIEKEQETLNWQDKILIDSLDETDTFDEAWNKYHAK